MEPMFLPNVENHEGANGSYSELIRTVRAAGQPVSQIWHLFAFKPDVNRHLERFTQGVMRGPSPLSSGLRELIAAYTSTRNQTPFCATTHSAATVQLLGDEALVREVCADAQTSRLTSAEKALFAFIDKVIRNFWSIGPADFKPLHAAGWSDEAIYDAITVCALFNFYNRWVSAGGVHQLPEEGIRASGERIAQHGYSRTTD